MLISGLSGGVAGGLSKLIVYPFDTMKKRMQAQVLWNTFCQAQTPKHTGGQVLVEDYSSLKGCFRTILRNEGFLSFYKVPEYIYIYQFAAMHKF
jgi:hypothetical protein